MVSRKYLIELPANVAAKNLGILFQPHTKRPTELGAQIRAIATSRTHNHTAQWQLQYKMKVGDVLYRVDGKLVTNKHHAEIIELLSSCKSLIFERAEDQPGPSESIFNGEIKMHLSKEADKIEEMPVTVPVPVQVQVSMAKQSMQQKRSTKPSPSEKSLEKNLLSSIFSPKNANAADDSMLSEYTNEYCREVEITLEHCPDLVAIPEGSGTDTSRSSTSIDFSRECASLPQQDQQSFQLASPTFSYSITTANSGTDCPMSPLGVGIPTSVSIATGQGSIVSSSRQQFHDSQVNMLKQKYASYLSPESDCKQMRRDGKPLGSTTKSRTSVVLNDDFPLRSVQCDPSMESCSVSTMFLSPTHTQAQIAVTSSSIVPQYSTSLSNTPLTTKTQQSESISYKNIPISMLDYKYVKECKCLKEIEKIIAALRSTSPPEFPSLLRMAENRSVALRGWNMKSAGVTRMKGNLEVCHEVDCDENDVEEGIPTHIHVENQTECQSALHGDELFHENVSQDELVEDMNDIVMAHAELKGHMEELLRERDVMQESLTSQVKSLEELLQSVKSEMDKQASESNIKIESIKTAKEDAEMEMKKLRETCMNSSAGVDQLTNDLKTKEKEIGNLAAKLYKEQESTRSVMQKAESVKDRLQAQVESLTTQLRVQVKKTQVTRTMIELQLRAEYDEKIRKDFALMNELEQKLNAATEDVQVLYKENELMATEFANVGMRFDSPEQFRGLLKEFSIAEACANSLAKALTESESELSTILRENSSLKAKVDVLEKENHRIYGESKELTEQMAAMGKELNMLQSELETYQCRQTNCDKLVKKCKAATESYKKKVNEFKAQIANGGHAVPIDIYKNVVKSSNMLAKSLKEKELQVQYLTERIHNLESINIKKKYSGDSSESRKSNNNAVAKERSRPVRGRAALLEKMQKVQSGAKGVSPLQKRAALKACNVSRTSRLSSTFVFAGKENLQGHS